MTGGFSAAVHWLVEGASTVPGAHRAAVLRQQADRLDGDMGAIPMHGCFRRLGDGWLLTWEGQAACIRHTAGMDVIAFLLTHPEHSYTAADIEAYVRGHAVTLSEASATRQDGERSEWAAQRKQLIAWRDSLADGHESLPEIARAIAELDRQLRGNHADEYEAARGRVQVAVSAAIRQIRQHLPALADDLRSLITVGSHCMAEPSALAT